MIDSLLDAVGGLGMVGICLLAALLAFDRIGGGLSLIVLAGTLVYLVVHRRHRSRPEHLAHCG